VIVFTGIGMYSAGMASYAVKCSLGVYVVAVDVVVVVGCVDVGVDVGVRYVGAVGYGVVVCDNDGGGGAISTVICMDCAVLCYVYGVDAVIAVVGGCVDEVGVVMHCVVVDDGDVGDVGVVCVCNAIGVWCVTTVVDGCVVVVI